MSNDYNASFLKFQFQYHSLFFHVTCWWHKPSFVVLSVFKLVIIISHEFYYHNYYFALVACYISTDINVVVLTVYKLVLLPLYFPNCSLTAIACLIFLSNSLLLCILFVLVFIILSNLVYIYIYIYIYIYMLQLICVMR